MDKAAYLEAFHRESTAMADAGLGADLEARVPSCPDWNLADLLGHVTGVYLHWNRRVRAGAGGDVNLTEADVADYPGLWAWFESDLTADLPRGEVVGWLRRAAGTLEETLAAADPDQPVDTWFPPDQTAGFVQRRMAQESAVHRWDAQSASGMSDPIEAALARDGIDEMLEVHLPMRPQWVEPRPGSGERYHLHQTDGEGEWLVEFAPEGVRVSREHARGDIAIRGSASDLLLWLWGRIPAGRLEVMGDRDLLGRWFELVPAD